MDRESMSALVRALHCKYVGGGDASAGLAYANSKFGPNSLAARILQKDVLNTLDVEDADVRAASRGFMELTRSRSLLGKINGWFKLPFYTPTLKQNTPIVATWVPEGELILPTRTSFDRAETVPYKIGSIIPVTAELLKGAGASFESALNRILSGAVADLEAVSLLDPLNAGVQGESPASLTYGVTPTSGSADPKDDIKALVEGFDGDLEYAVLISSARAGVALHDAGYENTGAKGGDVAGLTHITTSSLPDSRVVLLDPTRIIVSDSGVVFDLSEQTTLQYFDSNGDPEGMISLWQTNLAAIRVTRHLDWFDMSSNSVAYINDATWVS